MGNERNSFFPSRYILYTTILQGCGARCQNMAKINDIGPRANPKARTSLRESRKSILQQFVSIPKKFAVSLGGFEKSVSRRGSSRGRFAVPREHPLLLPPLCGNAHPESLHSADRRNRGRGERFFPLGAWRSAFGHRLLISLQKKTSLS